MIIYKVATMQEIDLLVSLRLKELAMFSEELFPKEGEQNIKLFYENAMSTNQCYTILGYDREILVTTGTIYFNHSLPSNANPSGMTGYITNIWTKEEYRHQGIASNVMNRLLQLAEKRCGLVCLNASTEGEPLYLKKGFIKNEKAMYRKR